VRASIAKAHISYGYPVYPSVMTRHQVREISGFHHMIAYCL